MECHGLPVLRETYLQEVVFEEKRKKRREEKRKNFGLRRRLT
jgi:hypothetical protein